MSISREMLRDLYFGSGRRTRVFHLAMIAVDLAAVAYFLATVRVEHVAVYRAVDLAIFAVFAFELAARLWADERPIASLARLSTITDLVVLASLALPLLVESLGFLRIVRTLRFLRVFRISDTLRRLLPIRRRQEDVFTATMNLAVFVFVVTSTVWVLEARTNPHLNTWIDALYFTVTTLTTTGYGDITMTDPLGRLLTVFIMIFGVALFFRLAQAIFRPTKAHVPCQKCGLQVHDPDASHCKHCGSVIRIETEGDW